jgi:hypothetical protein
VSDVSLIGSRLGRTISAMTWVLITSALAMLPLGATLRWYLTRDWARCYANPKAIVFPRVCPVCLGPGDVIVEEDSAQRVTANYVVWRKLEWWSAKIPHCSKCERKQARDVTIGVVLGAICGITIFIFTPAPEDPREIIFYAFFAYPFYILADHLHKGVALGRASSKVLYMRIRHPEYFDRFIALNSPPAVADIPLADNKGVWRH